MADQQWYMALGGHQVGPVAETEIVANVRNGSIDANTHLFSSGMSDWTRLKDIPQFALTLGRPGRAPVPTPPGRTAHEIDFELSGTEMQFVEVELDPGESAVARAVIANPNLILDDEPTGNLHTSQEHNHGLVQKAERRKDYDHSGHALRDQCILRAPYYSASRWLGGGRLAPFQLKTPMHDIAILHSAKDGR